MRVASAGADANGNSRVLRWNFIRRHEGHYAEHPPWRKQPGFEWGWYSVVGWSGDQTGEFDFGEFLGGMLFGVRVAVNLRVDLGFAIIRNRSFNPMYQNAMQAQSRMN
jgi:hypothetical protein